MSNNNPVLIAGGVASNQSVYEVVTDARHRPGTQGVLRDGRRFEYVRKDHATVVIPGNLMTYEPVAAGHDDSTMVAAAIGDTEVSFSMTITLLANELNGGFINMENDAGEGELYGIVSHVAHTSGTLVVQIERPVVTAITTATDATIIAGPTSVKISTAVVADVTAVEAAAGVVLVDVPDGSTTAQYFWLQKTGLASVLFGTVVGAVGNAAYQGELPGSLQASVDTTAAIHQPTLAVIVALLPVDTEFHCVRLSID